MVGRKPFFDQWSTDNVTTHFSTEKARELLAGASVRLVGSHHGKMDTTKRVSSISEAKPRMFICGKGGKVEGDACSKGAGAEQATGLVSLG